MPDDTVKNINLAIPSTSIQEHPQNVTVIPRRRKRRGDQGRGGEAERDGAESGALGTIEDKVTISSSMSGEEGKDRGEQEEKNKGRSSKQENGSDTKHIDIKV